MNNKGQEQNPGQNTESNSEQKQSSQNENLYMALVSVRNTELSAYWQRNSILQVINFGLLGLVYSARTDSFFIKHKEIIGSFGIFLSLIWLLFQIEGKNILSSRYENYIRRYEKKLNFKLFTLVRKTSKPWWIVESYKNLNFLTRLLPLICSLGWAYFIETKALVYFSILIGWLMLSFFLERECF